MKDLVASLEVHARFPVEVDFGDGPREFTVLGTRLFFDPSKPELPWTSIGHVATFALGARPPSDVRVMVENNGVEEQFEFPSKAAEQRSLRPGDRIRFVLTPGFPELREHEELNHVVLAGADFPYRRASYGPVHPSLIEMLLDSQRPSGLKRDQLNEIGSIDDGSGVLERFDPEQWQDLRVYFRGFTLLPHPDLSDIRIRRKNEKGETNEIQVNLAAAISAYIRDGAGQDAAKAHDVFLQAGDVVEIRMRAGMENVPWRGFNDGEMRFFSSALAGEATLHHDDGRIEKVSIACDPQNYLSVLGNPLPLPSKATHPAQHFRFDELDWGRSDFHVRLDRGGEEQYLYRDADVTSLQRIHPGPGGDSPPSR